MDFGNLSTGEFDPLLAVVVKPLPALAVGQEAMTGSALGRALERSLGKERGTMIKKQNINEHKHTVAAQTLLILNIFTRKTSNIQVTWPHNTGLKTNGACVLGVHLCSRNLDRHRRCGQQTWGGRMHGWGVHGPQTTLT